MKDRIWDNSTIDCFQTCRRKYYWRHVRHLTTRTKSQALVFGGAIHDALDVFYCHFPDQTKGLKEALTVFGATYKDREGDELRTKENGMKMLIHYSDVYKNEPFTPVGKPEAGFVFSLAPNLLYGGRLDLPIDWDGALWILEHKTTSRLSSNFFRQFDLDKQLTGYTIGMEEYTGRKCHGCIVNAMEPWKELKRPTAKSKTVADHFCRNPAPRSDALKERFRLNVQRIVRDIRWCEANNEYYEADKKDVCFYYNYDCPYKTLCQFGDDERVIARDFLMEKWEPYTVAIKKGDINTAKKHLEEQEKDK